MVAGKKQATIVEIARRANTSTATVSRVLNGSDYPVSPALRETVIRTAKELNYVPNAIGRSLQNGKSNDIGVIVPNFTNPFYVQLISGIDSVCRERGYNLIISTSNGDSQLELEKIELLRRKCVEGLILSTIHNNTKGIHLALQLHKNVILFDQETSLDVCDHVSFDFERGGYMAARYLLEKGHRHIAFLSAPLENRASRRALYRGCMQAVEQWGGDASCVLIEDDVKVQERSAWEYENGRKLADDLLALNPRPTAAFVYNDMTAISVMSHLMECGVRVPEDISVIGFDNILMAAYANPPLTTINQPACETGAMAARIILDKIEEKNRINCRVNLSPELVERKSVKDINT